MARQMAAEVRRKKKTNATTTKRACYRLDRSPWTCSVALLMSHWNDVGTAIKPEVAAMMSLNQVEAKR